MHTVDYSHVVGVFRERSNAEQAIDKLKRIGIGEDLIQLTEYDLQNTEWASSLSQQETNKRLIVNVEANGKEQEAVGILVNNGANNADIPPGTELVHGSLISSNSETADLNHGQPTGESTSESFFGKNVRDPYIP
jgi:hypothetical protein